MGTHVLELLRGLVAPFHDALTLGGLIFVSYTIISVNTVAMAKSKYLPTFLSSAAFMLVNFFLIKHVADAKSTQEFVGYFVGGVSGDLAGIYISKKWNI